MTPTEDADVLALEETIARELWLICNSQYHSATPERLDELWAAEKSYDGWYRYQNKWLPMARRARALSRPVAEGFVLVPKASVEKWRGYLCHNNQLLDGWHQDGTVWTDWDTKVRADMSQMQREVEDIWSAAPARED